MSGRPPRVAVLGGGSWGTTVAAMVAENVPTILWARNPDVAREVEEEHLNTRYLGDLSLSTQLHATDSLPQAVDGADVLVMAIPSQSFRGVLEDAAPSARPWIPVVSLIKGLEQGTRRRMTEIVGEILPGHPAGVLAGPNLAKEVLAGHAAAATIAMPDEHLASAFQAVFRRPVFRVYRSTDVAGVELGGALKNVIAIAAGMGEGAGAGDNTRAMVITRGLRELARLGVAMGGEPDSFAGLAGMGDLIATCMSPLSRNRHAGEELARGKTVEQIVEQMGQVAEGIKTASVVMELAAEHDVEMPIAREVDAVVNHGRTVEDAYRGLLRSAPAHEVHGMAG